MKKKRLLLIFFVVIFFFTNCKTMSSFLGLKSSSAISLYPSWVTKIPNNSFVGTSPLSFEDAMNHAMKQLSQYIYKENTKDGIIYSTNYSMLNNYYYFEDMYLDSANNSFYVLLKITVYPDDILIRRVKEDYESHEIIKNVVNDDFIFVEGGTFNMGSNPCNSDEKHVYSVTVNSFYICDHEVTQKEYKSVMGNNPSYFKGLNKPVEYINWYDAIQYCNMLSLKNGLFPCYKFSGNNNVICDFTTNGYRLPTEAEWEYAACGGKLSGGYIYSGSINIEPVGWYDGNSNNKTHDIKTKLPNELGIYDMCGNVWEMCWYWKGIYIGNRQPNKNEKMSELYNFYRGGSWYSPASDCYNNIRIDCAVDTISETVGFRVVRTAE